MSTTTTQLTVVSFTQNAVYGGTLLAPEVQGTFTLIGSGPSALAGPDIESAYMIDPYDGKTKLFAVDGDGSIIVDVIDGQLVQWADRVTQVGKGTLPPQCALICVYRGRMVLARQPSQPTIFYMSRTLNPYDWLFGSLPRPTTAVAGTDPEVGQPHDAINALIPFSRDYLIFGCLSSMFVMEGDPAQGGTMQQVSKRTGVLGPRAWCQDERGIVYFLANSGLCRIVNPTTEPENIGGVKLLKLIDRVDITDDSGCRPELAFDAFKKEIHIYLTPRDDTVQGTHVIVDRDSMAMWLDEYPLALGPHSTLEIDGELDDNRRILLGGDDGYVRRWRSFEKSDDSNAITSYFDSAPMELQDGLIECTATELQPFFFAGSDQVDWNWYVEDSPDQVRTSTSPVATGTIDAGYNIPTGLRQTGGAHRLRVTQTSAEKSWAMERLAAKFVTSGRRR